MAVALVDAQVRAIFRRPMYTIGFTPLRSHLFVHNTRHVESLLWRWSTRSYASLLTTRFAPSNSHHRIHTIG